MMISETNPPKRTVGDLYSKATEMFVKQMEEYKKRPLNEKEKQEARNLAVLVSKGVLKDMKLI